MRREPRTLDTRLLGLFPSPTVSLGKLPAQSVRPYTQAVSRLQRCLSNERMFSHLRRGVTCFAIPRARISYNGSGKKEWKRRRRCDARRQGATTPTHGREKFTNNCWKDCSDPRLDAARYKTKLLCCSSDRRELRGDRHEQALFGKRNKIRRGGLSARIRFDKTKMSGRHEHALFGRGERI